MKIPYYSQEYQSSYQCSFRRHLTIEIVGNAIAMIIKKIKKALGITDNEASKKQNVKVAENIKNVDKLLFGDEWLNICRINERGDKECFPNDK